MISQFLDVQLKGALNRTNKAQKYVRIETKTPGATLSDHVNGKQPVNIKKALEYAESLDDSKFYSELAAMFFGMPNTLDDVKYKMDVMSLDVLREKEESESKQAFNRAKLVLITKESERTREEQQEVLTTALELIDEISVELTMLISLLDQCGLTILDAVEMRKSYLVQQKYIRKG